MKDGLTNPNQGLFTKEENLMIDKSFPRLKYIKWFIEILFLIMIPINVVVFFTGIFSAYNDLQAAINDIYQAEILRKHFVRTHNSIITLLMYNTNMYSTVDLVD